MKKVLVINTVDYIVGGMSTVIMNYYQYINHQKYHIDFIINDNISMKYLEIMKNGGAITYRLERNRNPIDYFLKLVGIIKKIIMILFMYMVIVVQWR